MVEFINLHLYCSIVTHTKNACMKSYKYSVSYSGTIVKLPSITLAYQLAVQLSRAGYKSIKIITSYNKNAFTPTQITL